jgi:hypothetical protein
MSRIEVKISPTVTQEQRQDPRFIKLLKNAKTFFNCSCVKCARQRLLISLHEGGHAYFAKKAGATNIKFCGPTMYWDSRINPETSLPYDCPAISRSSVSWTCPASDIDNIKVSVAGYVCRRELSELPNDRIAIGSDIAGARDWYLRHIGGTEEGFQQLVDDAEKAVTRDLQSSTVREEIWAEAKRFRQEILPAPKLTSGLLRARRLGLSTCTASAPRG